MGYGGYWYPEDFWDKQPDEKSKEVKVYPKTIKEKIVNWIKKLF